MRNNLYEFVIRTYNFGIVRYSIYVRAMNIDDAKAMVINSARYHNDMDAIIESQRWIDMDVEGIIK